MKVTKVLMVWILSVLPLTVRVLQSEGQIPEKTMTEKSTELVPSLGKNEPTPEIKDAKPTSDYPHFLSTESGISYF